jgi:hypothetical protein
MALISILFKGDFLLRFVAGDAGDPAKPWTMGATADGHASRQSLVRCLLVFRRLREDERMEPEPSRRCPGARG